MAGLASFMDGFLMRGQHAPDRACTRYKYDLNKMVENNEISTGPGRYALGVPNAYGNATFAPNPTVRMQKWGASHDMSSTKTDVESDLLNLGRPTTRSVCGQYQPADGQRTLTAMPEEEFPRTYERLVDPPCTLRGTGINRWEWLCQNPQENVMIPFEHAVNSNLAERDRYYGKVTQPPGSSVTAREHQMFCSTMYVDPAVPVAKPQVAPKNFSNGVPGQSQRPVETPAPARVRRADWGEAPTGPANPDAPLPYPTQNVVDEQWRRTGILAPPTPFPAFIAPH